MPSLYAISGEIGSILGLIDEAAGEIPEDLHQQLDQLEGELAAKLEACCKFMRSRQARAAGLQAELDRLQAALDAEKRKAEWMKTYMKDAMEKVGTASIETPLFKLRIQKNPLTVRLTGTEIPEPYRKPAKIEFDKAKAIDDHKGGKPLPEGVEVVQGTHLRIA